MIFDVYFWPGGYSLFIARHRWGFSRWRLLYSPIEGQGQQDSVPGYEVRKGWSRKDNTAIRNAKAARLLHGEVLREIDAEELQTQLHRARA